MSNRKILRRSVTMEIYVGLDLKETPVIEMVGKHLVNAYAVSIKEENDEASGVLEREILRRMTK